MYRYPRGIVVLLVQIYYTCFQILILLVMFHQHQRSFGAKQNLFVRIGRQRQLLQIPFFGEYASHLSNNVQIVLPNLEGMIAHMAIGVLSHCMGSQSRL